MAVFAHLSKLVQWSIALLLAGCCLSCLAAGFALLVIDWRWFPLLLVIPLVLPPLESLLLTPLYVLVGRFRYYSPMLLATRRHDGGVDLHVGTLFDYVMRFRWADHGPRAARMVTIDLLRGLLALSAAVERGELAADAPIVGTSYFFNARTMQRFGFVLQPAPRTVIHNLLLASASIALRLSFTRGRLTIPNLRRTQQAVISGANLVQQKQYIQRVLDRIAPAVPASV